MFLVDDLPIKNWAKTLAFDFDIGDELGDMNITAVFPKDTTKFRPAWVIERITVYKTSPRSKTAITFYCNARIKGKIYTHQIRIFTPHIPRIDNLKDCLGRRVVGANFLCVARNKNYMTFVSRFIQTVDRKGRKSNPIMRRENEERSVKNKQCSYELDSFVDYGSIDERTFLETYFPKRDPDKFLISMS